MNALSLALYYLERRARTEKELRNKLVRKQIPPQEIEAVLTKLKDLGYVDDVKFAANYQRARNEYKPMGVQRLRLELAHKGVPREVVGTVSAEKEDERRLALAAAQSRMRQYKGLETAVFTRRMTGFLARRGFGYDTIKYVFEILKETSDEPN